MNATVGVAVAAAAAVLVACSASGAWRALALRRGWVDRPGQRRLHSGSVPRGGGVAIVLGLFAAAGVLLAVQGNVPDPAIAWLLPVALACLLGWLDDRQAWSPLPKLLGQAVVAAIAAIGWSRLSAASSAPLPLFLLALLLMNAWNFMDGSHGLAAGQALLCALALATMAALSGVVQPMGWWLAAACLGFLPWNVPVARLFLGDAGSHALGLGVLGLIVLTDWRGAGSWLAWLLPSAILVDVVLTLCRRALQGKPVWRAHREHLYQYAVRRGRAHGRVALLYAGWTALMGLLALALLGQALAVAIPVVAAAYLLAAILHQGLRRRSLARGRA